MIKNYKDYLITENIYRKPTHGYDLLRKLNYEFEIKKITLYKTLERLERDQIISILKVDNRRKIYQITEFGKQELMTKRDIYPEIKNRKFTKIGEHIEHFEEIDSTNLYLKNYGDTLAEGYIAYADYQSQGRGRLSRKWENEKDQNVSMSILVKPEVMIHEVPKITQVAAACIWQVLKENGVEAKIKWPNDIIVDGKKICGILVESKLSGTRPDHIVVGIGLNVNTKTYQGEIRQKAISMHQVTDKKYVILDLVKQISHEFEVVYNQFINGNNGYLEICRDNSFLLNKEVKVNIDNTEITVKVIDIAENGQLLVEYEGEIISLNISEVTLESNY